MARRRNVEAMHEVCRTFGHAWYESTTDKKAEYGVLIALRCERCDTERLDNVDYWGNFLRRRYDYPDGYQYNSSEGEAAPTRQEWRQRWMLRHEYTNSRLMKQSEKKSEGDADRAKRLAS